jgi:AcrR family transcriptional regulator
MARPKSGVQNRILEAVDKQLRLEGAATMTLDRVAKEAGCAKGLINYHFKTKGDLFAAAADKIFSEREIRWKSALSAPNPEAAIGRSWRLICDEVDHGFWKAWNSLSSVGDELTVRTVNNRLESFCRSLAASVRELLRVLELKPSVPGEELGHLVAAAIHGFETQLASGVTRRHVESGHAALWVAVLALAAPEP